MKSTGPLKLGGVAAPICSGWSTGWCCGMRLGPQKHSWIRLAAAAKLAAWRISRQVAKPYPTFPDARVGLLLLVGSWVTYDPESRRPFFHFGGEGAPSYSDVSEAGFVFTWTCAWGYLVIAEWQRKPPSALTSIVFAILMFGLAIILANFYFREYSSTLDTIARARRRVAGPSSPLWPRSGLYPARPTGVLNWLLMVIAVWSLAHMYLWWMFLMLCNRSDVRRFFLVGFCSCFLTP
jgi:hypothetical protein